MGEGWTGTLSPPPAMQARSGNEGCHRSLRAFVIDAGSRRLQCGEFCRYDERRRGGGGGEGGGGGGRGGGGMRLGLLTKLEGRQLFFKPMLPVQERRWVVWEGGKMPAWLGLLS